MTPKERITSLIASMGYTVSACSEKADLITTLFYRSDHIYQLECFTGDWDRIWLWGAAHDDDWDHSEAGRSVGILIKYCDVQLLTHNHAASSCITFGETISILAESTNCRIPVLSDDPIVNVSV